MKKFIALFTLLTAGVLTAAPQVFGYWVEGYPGDAAACDALAKDLGGRLVAGAPVTLYRASGAASGKNLCQLDISYLADKALPLVSTHPEDAVFDGYDKWSYASLDECNANLPGQAELFTRGTGLKPLVAYCYSTTLFHEGAVSILKIDAFGAAAMPPRYFAVPVGADAAAQDKLDVDTAKALVAQGAIVSRVAHTRFPQYDESRDGVFYYAPNNLAAQTLDPDLYGLVFHSADECASQATEAASVASALGATLVSTACTPGIHRVVLANVITVQGLPVNAFYPRDSEYASLAECLADRPRMIALQVQLGHDARAAMCTWYRELLQSHYKMVVYSH